MKKIYLDYMATTPVDPRVKTAMAPYFYEKFGNPGSLHSFGQETMAAVDFSREIIAKAIGADFHEVIFTGSATEANNLALRGVTRLAQKFLPVRIIVSSIEHESILETAKDLEQEGIEVIYLPVDKKGFVDLEKLKKSLNKKTILVSVIYANNEIGVIQPIMEILKIINEFKSERKSSSLYPLFHTDAVQSFQFLDCDVSKLGVDLMTLSAHKIYGPKGIGALYSRGTRCQALGARNEKNKLLGPNAYGLAPITTGGGQEFGLRSGTENVPAIVGFAKATELAMDLRESERKRISKLASYFWRKLKKIYPEVELNPNRNLQTTKYLPNILNISFPGHSAEDLLIKFDMAGIAVSAGSACSVRSARPSHVLQALDLPTERIKSSIRFSFGKFTTKKDVSESVKRIGRILNR